MITVFINSTQKQKLKIFLVNAKKYKLWLPKSSILGSFSWHIFVCSLFESLTIITFKYFSKSWLTPKLRSYKLPLTSLKLLSHYLSNWKLHETWKFSQSMGKLTLRYLKRLYLTRFYWSFLLATFKSCHSLLWKLCKWPDHLNNQPSLWSNYRGNHAFHYWAI